MPVEKKTVKKQLKNKDTLTTVLGVILGGIQAAAIDWELLFSGDPTQQGKLVAAIATAALGYFTNKK